MSANTNNSFESGMVAGIILTIFVVLIFQFGSWIGYYSCKSYVIENPNAVEKWKASVWRGTENKTQAEKPTSTPTLAPIEP